MKRIDELINKYLDSEISSHELEELQLLLSDEENYKSFRAYQSVEKSIKNIQTEKAPKLFTEKIMNIIVTTNQNKKIRKLYLPIMVNSIFIVMIFVAVVLLFNIVNFGNNHTAVESILKNVSHNLSLFVPNLTEILINKTIIFSTSIISLILLISFYYLFDSHKAFKKKLDNF